MFFSNQIYKVNGIGWNIMYLLLSLYFIFKGILRVVYKKREIPYSMWIFKKIFEKTKLWKKSSTWRNYYLSKNVQYNLGVSILIAGIIALVYEIFRIIKYFI